MSGQTSERKNGGYTSIISCRINHSSQWSIEAGTGIIKVRNNKRMSALIFKISVWFWELNELMG